MVALVAQAGKNKGNKNAALKPGEMGRIQWTQSLSGERLQRFLKHFDIDPQELDEKQLREIVIEKSRELFMETVDAF